MTLKLTTGLNVYCFVSSTHYTCTVIDMKLNKKKKKTTWILLYLIMYAVKLDTEQSQVFVRRSSGTRQELCYNE